MENKLPKNIPIFPLSSIVFFPRTNLPLNIFEERYLQKIDYLVWYNPKKIP